MNEKMSRRDFLKQSLVAAGVVLTKDLPNWVEIKQEQQFEELVEICTEVLDENELADFLESEDLEEALGLAFSFLLEKGIEPEEYLIMQDFLQ